MEQEILFTIIIPVYNTNQELFEKCIKSIIELDSQKYELIIVDDGSSKKNTECYKEILNGTHVNYNYIKIKNSGVSNARNVGIQRSLGKYVMFVDADDEILAQNVEYEILKKDYDFIFYNTLMISGCEQTLNKEIDKEENGIIKKETLLSQLIIKDSFNSPVAKFYKREILLDNKIFFDSNFIHGEDTDFNMKYLNWIDNIYFINKEIYIYKFDFLHYEERWEKNVTTIMNNLFSNYQSRLKLIRDNELDNQLINIVKKDAIKQLFRMKLINHETKKITNQQLKDYVKTFKIRPKELNIKNRIKFRIIMTNNYYLISFMTFLRRKHLERKTYRK